MQVALQCSGAANYTLASKVPTPQQTLPHGALALGGGMLRCRRVAAREPRACDAQILAENHALLGDEAARKDQTLLHIQVQVHPP